MVALFMRCGGMSNMSRMCAPCCERGQLSSVNDKMKVMAGRKKAMESEIAAKVSQRSEWEMLQKTVPVMTLLPKKIAKSSSRLENASV